MNSRITSLYLLLAVLISTLLPQSIIAKEQHLSFQHPVIQGEIAYVKDGDIWLLNLSIGESQQLTTDGNNQWPTWSPDGRYLLYTHTVYEDRFELYIFDTLQKEKWMLASDACCALWDQGDRIYYLNANNEAAAVVSIWPDGTEQRTETGLLSYGSGVVPTGNLVECCRGFPLEVVTMAGSSGLTIYADFFDSDGSDDNKLDPVFNDPDDPLCSWYNISFSDETRYPYAVTFMRDQGRPNCGNEAPESITFSASLGLLLFHSNSDVYELPWLAYPDISPDKNYLVAEQYAQSVDPHAARLEGLILYNLQTEERNFLLADAGQPAWRPNPPTPDGLIPYVQPGERVVTLEPSMRWGNSDIQIHVVTTGSYRNTDATVFFQQVSPTFFDDQQIVALLVTMNGVPMVENAFLKEILLDYATSAVLYGDPVYEVALPDLAPELQIIIENPAFQDTKLSKEIAGLSNSQSSQSEQALAAILTDQISIDQYLTPLLNGIFTDNVSEQISSVEDGLEQFRHVVEAGTLVESVIWQDGRVVGELPSNLWADLLRDLDRLKPDKGVGTTLQVDSALMTSRALIEVLFVSYLQQERLQWLYHWISDGSWLQDRNQLRAVASIMQEAEILESKRVKIVSDLLHRDILKSALERDEQAAAQVVKQLKTQVLDPSGYRLTAHAASSVLTSDVSNISAGALLYGDSEVRAHFQLANQAAAWRTSFSNIRRSIQDYVQQNWPEDESLTYDGNIAYKFRRIILLEALAAIAAQRSTADGISAVFATGDSPDILPPAMAKDEWQEFVTSLNKEADVIEFDILDTFARPSWLSSVLELIKERKTDATVIDGSQQQTDLPILHPGWTSFTYNLGVGSLLAIDDTVWAGSSGGLVRWHGQSGKYDKVMVEHGLGNNNVRTIFQSSDGAVWFGTWDGVSRLDPNGHWETYTTGDGLADNLINTITQSADGSIWFGTNKGGVSRLDLDGRWTTFTVEDGLIANEIRSIAEAADGSIWFGTPNGATRLDADGNWTNFTTTNGLSDNSIQVIMSDMEDNIWFGTGKGVSQLSPDRNWHTFLDESNDVNTIFQSADGAIWFGTYGFGASRYDSFGNWRNYGEYDGLASSYVFSIAQTEDGAMWFSTSGGMSRLAIDGSWTTFTIDSPSALEAPRTIIQTSDGALWMTALSNGVSRLSPDGSWTTYTKGDGLASNGAYTVFEDKNGLLWFGTPGGINQLNLDGVWTTFTVANGLADDATLAIAQSDDGVIWFGGINGLSYMSPDGTWSIATTSGNAVDNTYIQAILEDDIGTLWIGTENGINRLDPDGNWSSITTVDSVTIEDVQAIFQSTDNVLWFGTRGSGVVRIESNGSQTLMTIEDGLAGNNVRAIFQSKDDTLWFGTDAGLSRLSTDGTWMTFTAQDGLSNNGVLSITQSDDGALWIGTWDGISRLDLKTVFQSE